MQLLSWRIAFLLPRPPRLCVPLPRILPFPPPGFCATCSLAVSKHFQNQGISELLLLDALRRALENTREVASAAVVVDAKNEPARQFYLRHDFLPLPSHPNRLFYPMKTIAKLFPHGTSPSH
jgi:ribosomal protein S18 acetylase RimI-like enzyme